MNSDQQLLVLSVPPALEDSLVDWLLENENCAGFTSSLAYGHSHNTQNYNLTEQVTGRQKRIQFQLFGNSQANRAIINGLENEYKNSGLHYWLMPVIEEGRL
ncbi:MAG TPA: DUF3240 domain-containing protein [Chromatiales bacterium]|nr:DUF3240 domain-containing protein [Thiotrichales bacterium]HIP69082.1 DUF3240 domain-containing protein [Chromatiales bacterium]